MGTAAPSLTQGRFDRGCAVFNPYKFLPSPLTTYLGDQRPCDAEGIA